jgi:hypothetical protein
MYKYKRITTPGPNGTVLTFRASEGSAATEIADLDGWHYVHVPDGEAIPDQHADIEWTSVTMTDELRAQLRASSRHDMMIRREIQRRIRDVYSADDEQYFSRIGVGAALGMYQFQPGEQEALLEFGTFIEGIREWGRAERAKIGL